MKEIKLTQGKVALVDDVDYDVLNQFKWFAHKGGDDNTYYAGRSIKINGNYKQIWMHRIIMETPNNLQVDHIDHNGLNNQRSNLRNCTHHQNHMNLINYGISKYRGVSYFADPIGHKRIKKIRATITLNNKIIYIGLFKTEEEAARAYDAKAKELFGEFANLNFPNE